MGTNPTTRDDIARLPLRRFAQLGKLIEMAVPWAKRTLFLVGEPGAVSALVREGVSPGRIWTADEVLELLAAGVRPEDASRSRGRRSSSPAGSLRPAWTARRACALPSPPFPPLASRPSSRFPWSPEHDPRAHARLRRRALPLA